ncbi:SUMO1 sentrin specific peptidase 1 [Marasmius crinis-equi]|uniref:SUMO1 sentrin specific peptidase 1 n=1 Tax=Marasmius crinis-equi TaxID=585013 RepID=A0ABR3FC29_9AGAR
MSEYLNKHAKNKTFDVTQAVVDSKGSGRGVITRLIFALIFLDRAPLLLRNLGTAMPPPNPIPRTRILGKKSLGMAALKALEKWPSFFRDAELALEAYDKAGAEQPPLDTMNFNQGSVASVQMNMISKCLRHLHNVKNRIAELKIQTITLNIELDRYLEGQVLPAGDDPYEVTKLRTALHTALALSPLILLSHEINLFKQDPQAANLLQLWFHFGNLQPPAIQKADSVIWEEVITVDGVNKTALGALRNILRRMKPILCDIDTESQKWFSCTYGELDYREQTPIWPWIEQLSESEREGGINTEEKNKDRNRDEENDRHGEPENSSEANESAMQHQDNVDGHVVTHSVDKSDNSDMSITSQTFGNITGFETEPEDAAKWLAKADLPDRIVINNTSLYKKDLVRLQTAGWLNDEVINMFLGCYQFPPKCWVLSSLLWTVSLRKMDARQSDAMIPRELECNKSRFRSCNCIMIPIHDQEAKHWIAVAVDRDDGKITVWDSLHRTSCAYEAQLQHVKDWLREMYRECALTLPTWSEDIPPTQGVQTNHYDCGVFTIGNIVLHALTGGTQNYLLTQRLIPSIRAEILRRLLAASRHTSPNPASLPSSTVPIHSIDNGNDPLDPTINGTDSGHHTHPDLNNGTGSINQMGDVLQAPSPSSDVLLHTITCPQPTDHDECDRAPQHLEAQSSSSTTTSSYEEHDAAINPMAIAHGYVETDAQRRCRSVDPGALHSIPVPDVGIIRHSSAPPSTEGPPSPGTNRSGTDRSDTSLNHNAKSPLPSHEEAPLVLPRIKPNDDHIYSSEPNRPEVDSDDSAHLLLPLSGQCTVSRTGNIEGMNITPGNLTSPTSAMNTAYQPEDTATSSTSMVADKENSTTGMTCTRNHEQVHLEPSSFLNQPITSEPFLHPPPMHSETNIPTSSPDLPGPETVTDRMLSEQGVFES